MRRRARRRVRMIPICVLTLCVAFPGLLQAADSPPPQVEPRSRAHAVVIPGERTIERFSFDPGDGTTGLEYAGDGFFRGSRLAHFIESDAPVTSAPVEAEPREDLRLSVAGGTLRLWFRPAGDRPLAPLFADADADGETRAMLAAIASNSEGFDPGPRTARSPRPGGFVPTDLPSLEGSPVEFVIITDDAMAPAFEELATLRSRFGRPAVVRTLSWIMSNYPDGTDLAERVRHFLRDAYALWGTRWALLGADTEILPVRFVRSQLYDPAGQLVATDLYYSCLDGNWNANGDSYFGEPDRLVQGQIVPGDEVDFYPELWVGRIPVTTLTDAQAVIDKIETYWLSPPAGFLDNLLYEAEVLSPTSWQPGDPVYLDGASIASILSVHAAATMSVTKMFENYTQYPGSIPETRQAAIDSIEAGFGWVHHIGHGFRYNMSVGNGNIGNSDADAFTNGPRIGILYAMNCSSGAVHYSCIGEHMLRNPDGGAVAFLGSTDLDLPTVSLQYEDTFYTNVFEAGIRELGRCLGLAKIPLIVDAERGDNGYRFNQFSLILLGDPALPIYTGDPGTLAVTHAAQWTIGDGDYSVHVEFQSAPVESALVCLDKGDDAYAVAITNASGDAVIPWNAHLPGAFHVSVFRRDHRPYQGTASAVTSAAAHLYVSEVAVSGDGPAAKPWPGRALAGDGQADAGETISLTMTLANSGADSASSVSAVLRTSDPLATIPDSTALFGTLPAGGSAPAADPFVIALSRATTDRHEIRFTVEATSGASSWIDVFDLLVRAPAVDNYALAVLDTLPGCDRDGQPDPGETIDLVVTLRNDATGTAQFVRGELSAAGAGVTMLDSLSTFGSIAAATSADGTSFRFSTTTSQPGFTFTALDTFGVLYARGLDLVVPAAPTGTEAVGKSNSIVLTWVKNAETDLAGYHVYRSEGESGPFDRINGEILDMSALYADEWLPPLTRRYYRVTAADSSGNESAPSPVATASTSPPPVPGWPILTDMAVSSTGPKVVDLDGDQEPEVTVGSGNLFVVHGDGTEYIDGDSTAITLGVFSSLGNRFWSSPAVADLDDDGVLDIVACAWEGDATGDEKAYIWDADGNARSGWPKTIGSYPWSSPALGDIDGDGDVEIVIVGGDAKIYAWRASGVEIRDGDANPATDGVFFVMNGNYTYGSPALADMDNDAALEIIATERLNTGDTSLTKLYVLNADGSNVPGFPVTLNSASTSSPAVADVDGDLLPEIAVGARSSMRLYEHDGQTAPGWPKTGIELSADLQPSPAIADLDADGDLDIILGSSDAKVYAWQAVGGAALPGFPVDLGGGASHSLGSATVGNLDADPQLEIVIPDVLGLVNALNHDGSLVAGFPFATQAQIFGSAAIADIDSDGTNEVVAYSVDKNMYALDLSVAPAAVTAQTWPMFRYSPAGTGWIDEPPRGVDVPDPAGSAPVRPSLLQNLPNPMTPFTVIAFDVPEGTGRTRVTLRVFDASGRQVRLLHEGPAATGRQRVLWDGRDDRGDPVPSGVYFYQAAFEGSARETLARKLVVVR